MPRTHRFLGLTTALLLSTSTLVGLAESPARADEPTPTSSSAEPFAQPGGRLPAAARSLDGAGVDAARSARKKHRWPVRSRLGTLTTHTVTPQGDPSQQFVSVKVLQDRLKGTMTAAVQLIAAPTEATDARLRVGFGKVTTTTEGTFCRTSSGSMAPDVHSYGTSGAYDGDRITYRVKLAGAKTQAWDCAVAAMLSQDGSVVYDAVVTGSLKERRQKPILTIKVPKTKLKRSGFTRVPIKIRNSKQTIATAPKVKLSWKTKGAIVKAKKKVGKIKPGTGKKSHFLVRSTRGNRSGSIKFTVRSKNYETTIKLPIRPV